MIWVHCPHINIDQSGLLYVGKHTSIIPWLSNSHMALDDPNWKLAMEAEYEALEKNQT
jgi:hypothetical protein